jgi:hypothetical protein
VHGKEALWLLSCFELSTNVDIFSVIPSDPRLAIIGRHRHGTTAQKQGGCQCL